MQQLKSAFLSTNYIMKQDDIEASAEDEEEDDLKSINEIDKLNDIEQQTMDNGNRVHIVVDSKVNVTEYQIETDNVKADVDEMNDIVEQKDMIIAEDAQTEHGQDEDAMVQVEVDDDILVRSRMFRLKMEALESKKKFMGDFISFMEMKADDIIQRNRILMV